MNLHFKLLIVILTFGVTCTPRANAQSNASRSYPAPTNAVVLEVEGTVESLRKGSQNWDRSYTNQTLYAEDQLRTGQRSRTSLRLSDLTLMRVGELSHLRMPSAPKQGSRFNLLRGIFYFLHRDAPAEYDLQTPTVSAVVRGTEFNLQVAADGTTTLTLLDGAVEMSNEFGKLELQSGEQAVTEPGKKPVRTAVLASSRADIIQWCLYYPGVLDLNDLSLSADEQRVLKGSLAAYRSGDLLQAVALYPPDRTPESNQEKIYQAALLLAVGQTEKSDGLLTSALSSESRREPMNPGDGHVNRLGEALKLIIATVKFQGRPASVYSQRPASLATEWMAESYYQQSQSDLKGALEAAEAAVKASPEFGFAWARLAELEFSFGRIARTREAVEKSLRLTPRNAQALALNGFVHAAQNRWTDALDFFNQAIAIDGALGNAWLGRGLVRIHQGDVAAGREDLQVAALLEPQRALFRSYLGKAFSEANDTSHAVKELELAKQLDLNDPTAWFYSALLNQQQNRPNQAIRDLEHSKALNQNRSLFRSTLLLDQDQAVRGANLAAIYRDAGLLDVSVREAARAVNSDYGNYSAHLFLANSYAALRDPRQVNMRFETPWFNELLLANLLAPVGSGPLSQSISQQEYARLFERDRLGLSSSTEYKSSGDWLQSASQYGTVGNTSYALDVFYLSQTGQRPNDDIDQITSYAKIKQQLTPQDSVFFQSVYYDNESGDVRQYYDPRNANHGLRFKENQEPSLLLGYHREWTPGSHTLFLAARLDDRVALTDPAAPILTLQINGDGIVTRARDLDFIQRYRSDIEAYSSELQHIWQSTAHTLILGSRFQSGRADTRSEIIRDPTAFPANLLAEPLMQDNSTDLERLSFYGYHHWQILEPLQLTAGLSYDRLVFPRNIDAPPINGGTKAEDQVSPKAGFTYSLARNTHLRGAYTRSLGGLYYDTSVRLEPTQIAGFTQAYRSVIPESEIGLVPGSRFETWGAGLDHRFHTGTYLGLDGEILKSNPDRMRGAFEFLTRPAVPTAINEKFDFTEKTLAVTVNQLIGDDWALGARYRISTVDLSSQILEIPLTASPEARNELDGTLQQLRLFLTFHHPSGFFTQTEALWNAQNNHGYLPARPGDDFWQYNALAGYRFPRRRAEISLGLLNISDQDYRLNPLNLHPDLPRKRTFVMRLQFDF